MVGINDLKEEYFVIKSNLFYFPHVLCFRKVLTVLYSEFTIIISYSPPRVGDFHRLSGRGVTDMLFPLRLVGFLLA